MWYQGLRAKVTSLTPAAVFPVLSTDPAVTQQDVCNPNTLRLKPKQNLKCSLSSYPGLESSAKVS